MCEFLPGKNRKMGDTNSGLGTWSGAQLSTEQLRTADDNCQCDERWVGEVQTVRRMDLGCLERMRISELTLEPPSGEGNGSRGD